MKDVRAKSVLMLAVCAAVAIAPCMAFADEGVPASHRTEGGAPEVDDARVHFERGLQLYVEGAYDASLVELERAMLLAPTYKLFYNLGLIHKLRNDFAASLDAFQRYLAGGGDAIADTRRAEVEQAIRALSLRVANIQVTTPSPGVVIAIDDVVFGTTPLPNPIVVNPGRRKVTATVAGSFPATTVVTVVSGEAVKTVLSPVAIVSQAPVATPVAMPATAPDRPTHSPWTTPILAWSGTGALVVGAVVAGASTLSAANKLKDMRDTPGLSAADISSQESSVRTLASVTDVLLVGSLAGGALSTYLTVRAARSERRPEVNVGVGPAKVWLAGSF